MLSYQLLGGVCLVSLWVTAILVAAAAMKDLAGLRAARARVRTGLLRGEIVEGSGDADSFATHEVLQVGRALDGDVPAIAFRDRAYASRIEGGVLRVGDVHVRVAPGQGSGTVWTSRRAKELAASCPDEDAFGAAFASARTARGFARTVRTSLRAGDPVYLFGEIVREGAAPRLLATQGGELLVSSDDPRALLSKRARLAVIFVVVEVLVCAACTVLATWAPAFGSVATVGGALCLAFFLGVTPVGVWVRDRCRVPACAFLHGVWTAPGPDHVR